MQAKPKMFEDDEGTKMRDTATNSQYHGDITKKIRCAEKEKKRKYRENRDDHRILLERENDRD